MTDIDNTLLFAPAKLDACAGSIDFVIAAIERAAERLRLTWTAQ